MTKKQVPKKYWRYGAVKRTYKTILPDGTSHQETCYELTEVFDAGKSWSIDPISPFGSSKKELIQSLKNAIHDIENYALIVEKKVKVHDMRKKKCTKK